VRQLESIIRLSEALARLHLEEQIQPQWVLEASRLLRKSIITIDTDDIILNNTSTQNEEDQLPLEDEEVEQKSKTKKKKDTQTKQTVVSLSAERYNDIVNHIIRQMREQHTLTSTGITQSELINWLITNGNITAESDEELKNERNIFIAVINRMVNKDRTLLVTNNLRGDKRNLVLHPNYIPK